VIHDSPQLCSIWQSSQNNMAAWRQIGNAGARLAGALFALSIRNDFYAVSLTSMAEHCDTARAAVTNR
jgi:hypothetical protein